MTQSDILFIITARGGSKGIPGKNIKLLNHKPLIQYTIDVARSLTSDEHICVSTDSQEICQVVEGLGLHIPFLRPAALSQDHSGSTEVLLHAIEFYKNRGIQYRTVVLLQPTSPLRTGKHVKEAISLYNSSGEIDMLASVTEARDNPYFNMFELDEDGFLQRSKSGNYARRQDCPKVYVYNGAIYVININALQKQKLPEFRKVKKYEMDEESSIDIDTPLDFLWAEFIISNKR